MPTGVADRVNFEVAKADDYLSRNYDLICFFDSFHEMGWPVDAARHAAFSAPRRDRASSAVCSARLAFPICACRRDAVQRRHRDAPLISLASQQTEGFISACPLAARGSEGRLYLQLPTNR
jgi:hypothetical protein